MLSKLNQSAKAVAVLMIVAIVGLAYMRYESYQSTHFVSANYVAQLDDSAFDITMVDKAGPTSFTPAAALWAARLAAVAGTAAAAAKVLETLAETVDSLDHLVEAVAEAVEWNEEQKNEAKQEGGAEESISMPKLMASTAYPEMSIGEVEYMAQF